MPQTLSSIAHGFVIAARRLAAVPVFSGFAVLSLAFGVGVRTVAYSESSH